MAKNTKRPVTALEKAFARYKNKTGYKRLSAEQKKHVLELPSTKKAVAEELLSRRLVADRSKLEKAWNKEAKAVGVELLDAPKPIPKAAKEEEDDILLDSLNLAYGIGQTSDWGPIIGDFLEYVREFQEDEGAPKKSEKKWSFDGVRYTQKEVTKELKTVVKELFKTERFKEQRKLGYNFEKRATLEVWQTPKDYWRVIFAVIEVSESEAEEADF